MVTTCKKEYCFWVKYNLCCVKVAFLRPYISDVFPKLYTHLPLFSSSLPPYVDVWWISCSVLMFSVRDSPNCFFSLPYLDCCSSLHCAEVVPHSCPFFDHCDDVFCLTLYLILRNAHLCLTDEGEGG